MDDKIIMIGWIPIDPNVSLSSTFVENLRQSLVEIGVKGKILYNDKKRIFEHCEIHNVKVREALERTWHGFNWNAFTPVWSDFLPRRLSAPQTRKFMTLRERVIDVIEEQFDLTHMKLADCALYRSSKAKASALEAIRWRQVFIKMLIGVLKEEE